MQSIKEGLAFVLKWVAIIVGVMVVIVIAFPNSAIAYRICGIWNSFVATGGVDRIISVGIVLLLLWGAIHLINKLPGGGEKKGGGHH